MVSTAHCITVVTITCAICLSFGGVIVVLWSDSVSMVLGTLIQMRSIWAWVAAQCTVVTGVV